jgi:hypothetical protein
MHATVEPPYSIEQPTQWLKKMAPYLNVMIMVLKHAVPLAAPVLGITSESLAKRLSNDIHLMTELVTQLPADVPAGSGIEEELRPPELDVDYRALQALLDQVDPNHHWAGLILQPECVACTHAYAVARMSTRVLEPLAGPVATTGLRIAIFVAAANRNMQPPMSLAP